MRPFRFGVNMIALTGSDEWADKCRLAEKLGYDVILVPDHLGLPAPFPALMRAADATERARVGTFVLNAGFWNTTLLSREVNTLAQLTDGRFELGLGAGYVKAEFDAAGLPFLPAGERVSHLAGMVEGLGVLPGGTPLMLGGHGNRVLGLAGTRADIVSYAGAVPRPGSDTGGLDLVTAEELDGKVALVRAAAGERAGSIESNLIVQQVVITDRRRSELDRIRRDLGIDHLTADQLLEVPTLLVGTVEQIADQLRAARERFGISYVAVLEPWMTALAPVIEVLSGS